MSTASEEDIVREKEAGRADLVANVYSFTARLYGHGARNAKRKHW
jgi:hypothetical protein